MSEPLWRWPAHQLTAAIRAGAVSAREAAESALDRVQAVNTDALHALATLVAVFGMNPPEEIYPHPGFWVVLAAGIVFGFIVHGVVALANRKPE